MEDHDVKTTSEKVLGGFDGIYDAKGVKVNSTPAASSLPSEQRVSRPVGKKALGSVSLDGKNGSNTLINSFGIFESSSSSGDQHEDGIDVAPKKRKTRRGKPKYRKLKPYLKQQVLHRHPLYVLPTDKVVKAGRQPPAPSNTTQFLMDDHSDLPDLEQKLLEARSTEVPAASQKPPAPARTRDSSFSVDSDENYFYSSPEDEEEFLTKEFSSAYEDLHAERLGSLSKSELIQEYIQLETKVDLLTKRLRVKNPHQIEERESENKSVSPTDNEVAKKLKIYQQKIDDLIQQNEQLRRENESLRAQRHGSSASSIDSESDSDSTSNGKDENGKRESSVSSIDIKSDNCNTSQSGSPELPTSISMIRMIDFLRDIHECSEN